MECGKLLSETFFVHLPDDSHDVRCGNLLGAALFTCAIHMTELFAEAFVHGFLFSVVAKKLHAPASELFFRVI